MDRRRGDDRPVATVAAVVASTLFGVVTELLQESVPGREFERGDVVAGFVGSALGVVGWRIQAAG